MDGYLAACFTIDLGHGTISEILPFLVYGQS